MPTKAECKQLDATIAAFHTHYASPANGWGHQRWHDSLYPALTKPTRYAALVNQFVPRADVERALVAEVPEDELRVTELPAVRDEDEDEGETEKHLTFPPPKPTTVHSPPQSSQQLLTHWNMDAASALAAHMLDVRPGDKVLDLCSAPGGKSVALSQIIFANLHHDQHRQQQPTTPTTTNPSGDNPPGGCLHTNEPDPARAKRLLGNLRCYLPRTLFAPPAKAVQTFTLDASVTPRFLAALPHGAARYDRVLLDAPCSSERHIIQAHARAAAAGRVADDMARWRVGASRALQKTQAGLLVTALRAVRTGGRVLYSTCSVERGENDGVVERLWAEETDYGRIAVPDVGEGRWGPLFFCVLTKVERADR
ncbi:S-adenosyl-L-methionine-dependent methyltransferase [Phyllosticta citribraziliensis]